MVLSNLNNNMDVESRTMATMGDTLGGSGAKGRPWRGAHGRRRASWVRWVGPQTAVPLAAGRHPSAVSGARESLGEPCPLCLLSFERPPGCCTLLLPHGRGGLWVLHKENHEAGLNWVKPQVRNCTIVFSFGRTRPPAPS